MHSVGVASVPGQQRQAASMGEGKARSRFNRVNLYPRLCSEVGLLVLHGRPSYDLGFLSGEPPASPNLWLNIERWKR